MVYYDIITIAELKRRFLYFSIFKSLKKIKKTLDKSVNIGYNI